MNFREACFCFRHPVQALAAIRRQSAVSVEIMAPPHTVMWEEFTQMSIREAAQAMQEARPLVEGEDGPSIVWSDKDKRRIDEGKLPQGYPEHPFV